MSSFSQVEAWSPQAASLLADFGPGAPSKSANNRFFPGPWGGLNDGLEEAQVQLTQNLQKVLGK